MRNLLFQFKRAVGHMRSILIKLIDKMTRGAKLSVKTIAYAMGGLIIAPLLTIVFGLMVIIDITFCALGGAQIPIEIVSGQEVTHV